MKSKANKLAIVCCATCLAIAGCSLRGDKLDNAVKTGAGAAAAVLSLFGPVGQAVGAVLVSGAGAFVAGHQHGKRKGRRDAAAEASAAIAPATGTLVDVTSGATTVTKGPAA